MSHNLIDHGEWLNNLPERYNLDGRELRSTEEIRNVQDFYRSRFIFYVQQQARINLDSDDITLSGVNFRRSEKGRQFCYSKYRELEVMFRIAEENERVLQQNQRNQGNNNHQNNNDVENINQRALVSARNPNNTDVDNSNYKKKVQICTIDYGDEIEDKEQDPMAGFVCIKNFSHDDNPVYDYVEVQEFEISDDEWFLNQPIIYQYVLLFSNVLQTQLKQLEKLESLQQYGLQESDITILKYAFENPVINSRYMRERRDYGFDDRLFEGAYENIQTDFSQTWPVVVLNAQSSSENRKRAELADLQRKVWPTLITLQIFERQMNFSHRQIQISNLLNTLVQIRERYFYFYMMKEVSILEDPTYRKCKEFRSIETVLENCKIRYKEVNYLIKHYEGLYKELRS